MTDFLNYKFRCSGLVNLLPDPKTKSEPLSETTKTYLKEIWIAEVYGREKIITSKQMEKGIICETDSIELVEKVTGKKYFKNQKTYENEFIIGTPDIDTNSDDFIIDIKTSWDIWTFSNVDEKYARKMYLPQILGYMALREKRKGKISFCLVNLPEHLIYDEFRKMVYQGAVPDNEEGEAIVRKMYTYDDIPDKDKVKIFDFEFDDEMHEKLIERIKTARFYMNSLEL